MKIITGTIVVTINNKEVHEVELSDKQRNLLINVYLPMLFNNNAIRINEKCLDGIEIKNR